MKALRLAVCAAVIAAALAVPAAAFSDAVPDVISEFDLSAVYDALGDSAADIGTVEDFAGKGVDAGGFVSYFFSAAAALLAPLAGDFAVLLALVAGVSLLYRLAGAFSDTDAVSYASVLAVGTASFSIVSADGSAAADLLMRLRAFYAAAIPVMTGIYSFGGRAASAAAEAASSSVVLSAVGVICEDVILPASRLCLALALASALSGEPDLTPVSNFIKNFCSRSIALAMGLISSGLVLASRLARASDGVGLRVMRFAASSFVPIIGSAVSEATGALAGAISLVRSAFGAFGVTAVFYFIAPTIVTVFLHRSMFSFASSVAAALGAKREGAFLKGVSELYSIFISALVGPAVCFVIACGIFMETGV